ncbi:MAG: PrsW family glutamic-type intramembrane protease [Bacteroidales bacterium]
MLFAVSLIPIIVYIIFIYKIDHFALISIKRLLMLVLSGMLTALACFGLFRLTDRVISGGCADVVHPIIEELVKSIPLLILAFRKRIAFFIDSVICGAAVGGGFSFLENIFYLVLGDSVDLSTGLFRGLEVALIHMGCSAIIAAGMMMVVRQTERKRSRMPMSTNDIIKTTALFVVALAFHIFHNTFQFTPIMQFVWVLSVMIGMIAVVYFYDIDMTHRWLDKGLDMQINLLRSIGGGHLLNTPTGTFLESVKESFPPNVYFDIICYVRLQIELSVAAKTRFMLHEVGMDEPLEANKKELYMSQFVELSELEKNIGPSAKMTIAPIVKLSPADTQALNNLLKECKSK